MLETLTILVSVAIKALTHSAHQVCFSLTDQMSLMFFQNVFQSNCQALTGFYVVTSLK